MKHYGQVIKDVTDERTCVFNKYGNQELNPYKWLGLLTEETGEVAKALNDGEPKQNLYNELVQVAQVAIQWAETIKAEQPKNDIEILENAISYRKAHQLAIIDILAKEYHGILFELPEKSYYEVQKRVEQVIDDDYTKYTLGLSIIHTELLNIPEGQTIVKHIEQILKTLSK